MCLPLFVSIICGLNIVLQLSIHKNSHGFPTCYYDRYYLIKTRQDIFLAFLFADKTSQIGWQDVKTPYGKIRLQDHRYTYHSDEELERCGPKRFSVLCAAVNFFENVYYFYFWIELIWWLNIMLRIKIIEVNNYRPVGQGNCYEFAC